jgi:hypothetical protein
MGALRDSDASSESPDASGHSESEPLWPVALRLPVEPREDSVAGQSRATGTECHSGWQSR